MSEFKRYIERPKRVKAFQFLNLADAAKVADMLGADDFTAHASRNDFHLDAVIRRPNNTNTVRVRRGDFLVREGLTGFPYEGPVDIIAPADFYPSWEEEKDEQ